jgi:hypothetical protein
MIRVEIIGLANYAEDGLIFSPPVLQGERHQHVGERQRLYCKVSRTKEPGGLEGLDTREAGA